MPAKRHRLSLGVRVALALSAGSLSVTQAPAVMAAATTAAADETPALLGPGSLCGLVTGAPYSYRAPSGAHLAGNQYNVTAAATSCATAKSYAVT